MGDLREAIMARRSIRRYREEGISDEQVARLLESVQWSPSWANTQCWELVFVKDASIKEKLQGALPKTNPASKAIIQAPVVICLCGRLGSSGFYKEKVTTKFGDWFMYDLGIATQSICLTAQDLGLGTVIVGLFDHEKAKEAVGLPEGYELVSMIPVGFPAKDSPSPKRRGIDEFAHWDRF